MIQEKKTQPHLSNEFLQFFLKSVTHKMFLNFTLKTLRFLLQSKTCQQRSVIHIKMLHKLLEGNGTHLEMSHHLIGNIQTGVVSCSVFFFFCHLTSLFVSFRAGCVKLTLEKLRSNLTRMRTKILLMLSSKLRINIIFVYF